MSTIHHLDALTLFVGDDNPSADKGLFASLKSVKLYDLEEKTKEHMGSGALTPLIIGTKYFSISPFTFKIEGLHSDIDARFMPSNPRRIKYTLRGSISDLRDHSEKEFKSVIEGRMTKRARSEFERDKGVENDYEINEITFIKEMHDNQEKFYFNYWEGPAGLRINGALRFPTLARNLGLA